ncbi:hypothetical protein BD780_000794 [Clostridium tetanomorphum]|nr:hypothetical protein [Clostridium tetanomorphum]
MRILEEKNNGGFYFIATTEKFRYYMYKLIVFDIKDIERFF